MKNLTENLRKGAIPGLPALTLAACDNFDYQRYDLIIDGEQVKMYFSKYSNDTLEVKRKDGTIVRYIDSRHNESPNKKNDVNYITVTKNGVEKRYTKNAIGRKVVEEAQKQFNDYLSKILEKKQQEGLEAIKK